MTEPARPRIVAVVVTFNRLGLLEPLLDRLAAVGARGEGLDEILVIDNASTDGTGACLTDRVGAPNADDGALLRTRTLDRNRGGAGGFKSGLGWAIERDADLVWLMDDDGLPDEDCLAQLLAHRGDFDFWGPVVCDVDAPDRLVFPIRLPGGAAVVHQMSDVDAAARDGVIRDVVIPFNGVLLTRELVERIGLVREEFFIWGDDHEYRLRAERDGARIGTVVGARVLHPAVGALGSPMAFGTTTYNHSPSDLKHDCMARNNLINLRTYRGNLHALAFVAKTLWFYALTRRDPSRLRLSAAAMWAGLRGDFTGHERFL